MIYKIIYLHILLANIPHHYCTNKIQKKAHQSGLLMIDANYSFKKNSFALI